MRDTREVINQVYITDNFKVFKKMPGNRAVSPTTVNRLVDSFANVGYVPTPIICNERMEVIDGQNRLEACKKTNTPIAYMIIPGIGGAECISMNANGTKWKLMDYIDFYAEQDIKDYKLLKEYILKNKDLPMETILWNIQQAHIKSHKKAIIDGSYECKESDIRFAQELADYQRSYLDVVTNRQSLLLMAVGCCYIIPEVDPKILLKKVHQAEDKFMGASNLANVIKTIEEVYNYRQKGAHVYIETLYWQRLEKINKGIKVAIAKRIKERRDQIALLNSEVENNG